MPGPKVELEVADPKKLLKVKVYPWPGFVTTVTVGVVLAAD